MAQNEFSQHTKINSINLLINKFKQKLQEYFKYIIGLLVIGLLILGSSMFYSYLKKQNNSKAQTFIYKAQKALVLAEQTAGGNLLSTNSNQNFYAKKNIAKNTAELDQAINHYKNTIQQWISKPAGLFAASELSYFLYQYNKKQSAIKLLQQATLYKKSNLIGFLISLQLGTYLMDQGEYEQAIINFEFIIKNKQAKWLWADVLLKIALSYEKQNKLKEAQKTYQQIKNDFSDHQAYRQAIKYLNLLKLQQNIKNIK